MSPSSLSGELMARAEGEVKVAGGETLFRSGTPVAHLYVIVEGSVRLVRYQETGAALVVQRAVAGQLVAHASLFATCYHCDAVADAPSRALRVAKTVFHRVLAEDPGRLMEFTTQLASALQQARSRAELLSLKTVGERLDRWLTLAGGAMPPRGRWLDVADEIAVAPEALYRELARRRSTRARGKEAC